MSGVQRPGWTKPYIGCINWSRPGLPQAAVVYRGYSVAFDTWAEAVQYADTFVQRQVALRDARIARRQARPTN